MTRAIVLAAGEGTRLRPHTLDRPKCLVPLAGHPLLTWQVGALRRASIDDIVVVTGYRSDQIEALGHRTVHNPRFHDTNMVASLMCARSCFDGADDVVIAYGDLVYQSDIVDALLASDAPVAITVDRDWRRLWELRMEDPLLDAETMRVDEAGNVIELGRKPRDLDEIQGQYMGLIKVGREFATRFVEVYDELDPEGPYEGRDRDHMFMTSFLQHVIDHASPIAAVFVHGGWLEIDTTEDLEAFESMHANGTLDPYCTLVEG